MALPNDQTNSRTGKNRGFKFQALLISVIIHLIALAIFAVVRFSQTNPVNDRAIPMARVTAVKKLTETEHIIVKPKIKHSSQHLTKSILPKPTLETAKPKPPQWPKLAKSSVSETISSLDQDAIAHHKVEFFGAATGSRKICYLVDSSGSMKGIFNRVRKELKKSIRTLLPDQYFYIIFFGNDRLSEFGNGRLIRATENIKSAAYDFVDLTSPSGQTNAMAALERAVQIRDDSEAAPSVIYFLTDGFELDTDIMEFSQKTAALLKKFAPHTKINTIGFWPAESDRRMLRIMADQSDGQAIFITD